MRIIKAKVGLKQLAEFVVLLIVIGVLLSFGADIWMVLSVGMIMVLFLICLKDINANGFFFFFLVSFFIYLMSGDIAELIFDKHYYLQFDESTTLHCHICILISLASIWLGYKFAPIQQNNKLDGTNNYNSSLVNSIKIVSKYVYFLSFSILIINTLDTVRFVAINGYVSYYTSFVPMLPQIIIELGEFTPIALCVYLATFPTKKEASSIIKSYILYAVLSLLIGSRGGLIYNVIFILSYCFYRNYTDKDHCVWVSKKLIFTMLLSIPFLISFLFLYEFIRTGREIEFESFGDSIVDFFVNIGSSSKVIKYGYEYRDSIPKWRFYSLGETLNYFKYGTLFNLFSLDSIPPRHSVVFATQSHSLDAFISYLSMKTQFLTGHGTGSSFIAALYADFGYIAVSIGSFIYGWLFKKLSYINSNNVLSSSIKLYIFLSLLEAPRSSYDGFIASVVNINFVLIMSAIFIAAKSVMRRSQNKC